MRALSLMGRKVDKMMVKLSVSIPCYLGEKEVRIVNVTAPELGKTTLEYLTGVAEDGTEYPLRVLSDGDHKPLTDYQNAEQWHFQEWFRSLWKEENERSNPYHKEYQFTDSGQEYWYQKTDFKRHYTCEEG